MAEKTYSMTGWFMDTSNWFKVAWITVIDSSWEVTLQSDAVATANLTDESVTSDKISEAVIKVESTILTTAQVLALYTTPISLVAAQWTWTAVVVDKVIVATDFETAAYTTNTDLEFRYTDWSGTKVAADDTTTLLSAADIINTSWGLEALTELTQNAAVVATVWTWNAAAWDSDIKVTVVYRVVSI